MTMLGMPLADVADVLRGSQLDVLVQTDRVIARRGPLIIQAHGEPVRTVEVAGPPDAKLGDVIVMIVTLCASTSEEALDIVAWIRSQLIVAVRDSHGDATRLWGPIATREGDGIVATISVLGTLLSVTLTTKESA